MLNELRARADRADFGLVDNDYPWSDLKREFLGWTKQQNRVARDYDISLRWLEDYCPVKSIRQVTHQYVIGFRQWRLEHGIAPGTVNKNVAALLSMLGKAVEWQYIGANPIAGLKRLPVDKTGEGPAAVDSRRGGSGFRAQPRGHPAGVVDVHDDRHPAY